MFRESITFFKSYNRNIKLLLLGNIFIQIGLGITAIIYNFYIRSLGYEDTMNGQVISLTSLATALFLLPAGMMGDRKGRKKILLFGLAAAGIFMLLRSVLESASLLLSIAFLLGGATAFFQVMVIPMLAENSIADQRVHLFSFHFAITTAANVIGNLLGGFLTDVFKLLVEDISAIRLALLIGSIIFASAMIPFAKLAEPLKDAEQPPLLREPIGSVSRKIILIFFLSQLLIGTGSGLVIPYLNLYFVDRFHASNSAIGLILSFGQAGTAIAMFLGPAVVKRFGEVKAVVLLQMLSLPFLLITAFTGNLFVASIAFLFRQALMNAGNPIQMSLMMSLVNDRSKGVANSANQMAFNLGWAFMGPVSTTLVVTYGSYWGYAAVFSITSFIYFIATLYFFFVLKAFTKKNTQVAMS